jgi:NAD-dependent deacetylase sirtuin 4
MSEQLLPTREPVPSASTLAELLRGRRVAVLAGAGCSTESGIPDYRGPGSNGRHRPMQYREFVSDAAARKRYWARSTVGWSKVAGARPNAAHRALAALERAGIVTGVITQNVDGLHHDGGSSRVIELHGSLAWVRCLACGGRESRQVLQERLGTLNPHCDGQNAMVLPDGDAELEDARLQAFQVPECLACGGVLKPDVVFFGENVPRERVQQAWELYEAGDVLLVVGSSLTVFSGYRFVLRASKDGRPVAIVNIGQTRGDGHALVKIERRVGQVLPDLAERLCGAGVESG